MDISLLLNDLPEVENPGLDIFDPRFDEIVGFIDRAEYEEAANAVEGILQSGIYDIRTIGYFAYGIFLEQGPAIIGNLFDALSQLLNNNFEKIGPAKNREKQSQSAFRWFLSQLIKKLQYEEKKNDTTWANWLQSCNTEQVDLATDKTDIFRRALTANLEDKAGPLIETISKLTAWLNDFRQVAKPVIEDEPEEEQEETVVEETVTTPAVQSAPQAAPQAALSEGTQLTSKLDELQIKIDAFKQLCNQHDFTKASIVSEDLEHIIANFTPQEYFPQSFSQYFASMAIHATDLSPHWSERETLGWKALDRLYKVDPESFLNLDF